MRFSISTSCYLLLLAVSFSGCAQNKEATIQSKLVGTWQMAETDDLHVEMIGETMEDRADDLNATTTTLDTEDGFVAAKLEIEFTADGQLRTTHVMMNKPYEKRGTWQLQEKDAKDAEGDMINVNCDLPSGKTNTKITFSGHDTIRMIPPNFDVLGKEHTFKRVK